MLDRIEKSGLTYLSIDRSGRTVVVTAWRKAPGQTHYGRGSTISDALENLLMGLNPVSQFEDILG